MENLEQIKLDAYNSYKRHMRVFGKGNEILSYTAWCKSVNKQIKD